MTENDIYHPPEANLEGTSPASTEMKLLEPQSCPMGAGWHWIVSAWKLYKVQPFTWTIMSVIFLLLTVILNIVMLSPFVIPIFTAGFILSAAKVNQNETIGIRGLFAGFSKNVGTLLLIGLIMFCLSIVMIAIVGLLSPLTIKWLLHFTGQNQIDTESFMIFSVLISGLTFFTLQTLLTMLLWFAPALVVGNNQNAWQALILSFRGCLVNIKPLIIYGLSILLLFLCLLLLVMLLVFLHIGILSLPLLFLGLPIIISVLMLTFYTAYKDVFLYKTSNILESARQDDEKGSWERNLT